MEEVILAKVKKVVAEFQQASGWSNTSIGRAVLADGDWMAAVLDGKRKLSLRAHDKLFDWLAFHWPKDASAPAEIVSWIRFRLYDVIVEDVVEPSRKIPLSHASLVERSSVA